MQYVLSDASRVFRSKTGQIIVVSDPSGVGIFSSDDGVTYRQAFSTGCYHKLDLSSFTGTCVDELNPSHGYSFSCEGDELVFGINAYTAMPQDEVPKVIEYTPLPRTRKKECIFWLDDGRLLFASSLVFDNFWPIGGWHVYLGTPGNMRPLEGVKVWRGGRTGYSDRIETTTGTLWLRHNPRWLPDGSPEEAAVPASSMSLNEYDIIETEDSLVITTKAAIEA